MKPRALLLHGVPGFVAEALEQPGVVHGAAVDFAATRSS